jgi:hypothetical protein
MNNPTKRIQTYPDLNWDIAIPAHTKEGILDALEEGKVAYFPNLTIQIKNQDWQYLSPDLLEKGVKNISYDIRTNTIKGLHRHVADQQVVTDLIRNFAHQSVDFIQRLLPQYKTDIQIGRTSYRPAEVLNRKSMSRRKDDTLLHVDAFPATPTGKRRILRLFVNINPENKERLWRLGEPMENVLKYFSPKLSKPFPLSRSLMKLLGITRGYRTLYDHYMLRLHDSMKLDHEYQQKADQIKFGFPASSGWMVFTDVVSHAALSGQYLLEQTFYLPTAAMKNPQLSPLAFLSRYYSI